MIVPYVPCNSGPISPYWMEKYSSRQMHRQTNRLQKRC